MLAWDITYSPIAARRTFFYRYMFQDIWSRKIVGWEVHEREDNELAAGMLVDVRHDLASTPQSCPCTPTTAAR